MLYFGSDPEFFLINQKSGELKSAIGIVAGTKNSKIDLGNGNYLFYDNVLAEVNIKPGKSPEDFSNNVRTCLIKLAKSVYPYYLQLRASAYFPESECSHPDAFVFGCDPEFCAYEMATIQAPDGKSLFRSAGGHIHLGYNVEEWPLMAPLDDGGLNRDWGRVWVVRMLDLFLGIPSLWMDQDPTSPARRKLYGKAGSHRPKSDYGVEYRATSNFWLRSPSMVELTCYICDFVVNFVREKRHMELWKDEYECRYNAQDLRDAINNSDKEKGKHFLNTYVKKYMPKDIYAKILIACEPPLNSFYREWGISERL